MPNHNGYKSAEKINISTVIVHGDVDVDVPVKQSIKFAELLKNCELYIMKGASHRFNNEGEFDKMIQFISSFIIKECEKLER